MTIICRTIRIGPSQSAALAAGALSLAEAVASSRAYSDVYRYWDGIAFLLARHVSDGPARRWRELGTAIRSERDRQGDAQASPPPQHLSAADVKALADALAQIEPDALAPHYDAVAMDTAGVYPQCWVRWEETFDPLGQLLEHYHFLQQVTRSGASAGDGLLLVYEDDGDEPFVEDDE